MSAALHSVDRINENIADKDRMTSSRVMAEDSSDLHPSRDEVIESMRMSDEGDGEPSILEYILACLVGDPARTELGNLARRTDFWRARAQEVVDSGRKAGFRDPRSVNCVHSPEDVRRSFGFILVQSWDGVVSVPASHFDWALTTTSQIEGRRRLGS